MLFKINFPDNQFEQSRSKYFYGGLAGTGRTIEALDKDRWIFQLAAFNASNASPTLKSKTFGWATGLLSSVTGRQQAVRVKWSDTGDGGLGNKTHETCHDDQSLENEEIGSWPDS